MAYARIQHGGGAVPTTLGSDITSGDTSLSLAASTGWPDGVTGPFYLVVNPGGATEEKILATSRTSTTLNSLTRGVDGTSAAAHSSGETVLHVFSATEADEANVLVNKTLGTVTTKGDLTPATGAGALGRLAAGANNTLIVADSSQSTGLKYAKVVAANITAGTITTTEIADGTITGTDIAATTITAANIAAGTITTTEIADGTIATADLADGAVTSAKIADATIATADIANGAITEPLLDASLVQQFDFITGTPVGTEDVSAASFTTVDPTGTSTVPSWAVSAIMRTEIEGTSVTSGATTQFRSQIGTDVGGTHTVRTNGDTSNEYYAFTDRITLTSTGSKTVQVKGQRTAGSGTYRVEDFDHVTFTIVYLPS